MPVVGPSDVLIRVRAAAVNPGDIVATQTLEVGSVPGWVAAGVVERSAGDGSGPAVGARVVSLATAGAWARYRSAPTTHVAELPAGISFGVAASLFIHGGTALRALRDLNLPRGGTVLVTGANGGVGRCAVQLAALAGHRVYAVVRAGADESELRSLGAVDVLESPAEAPVPLDGVLDVVGGSTLVEAFRRLDAGGTVISVGRASAQPSVFDAEDFQGAGGGHGRSIRTFYLDDGRPGLAQDIEVLAAQVVAGELTMRTLPEVTAFEAVEQLKDGTFDVVRVISFL